MKFDAFEWADNENDDKRMMEEIDVELYDISDKSRCSVEGDSFGNKHYYRMVDYNG